MKGVVAQHALGYPAPGQIDFYVGIPCAVVVVVGGVTLLANAAKRVWIGSQLVSAAALIAILPYLFVYGGGV